MTKKLVLQLAALTCFIGSAAQADQVIADDLIVTKVANGLICVGQDCADGEDSLDAFGAVLELKDPRTQIHFNDTSTGDFPGADWVLRANDSFQFEENRFMLQTLEGGTKTIMSVHADAPTNALYVDAFGRVGLGTSMPDFDLHLVGETLAIVTLETISDPQKWYIGSNQQNFFIQDENTGGVPFRIAEGAPSSSIRIQNDGNVGLGTSSPDAPLELSSKETFNFFRITANGAAVNDSVDITFTGGPLGTGQLRYNIVDGDNQEMSLDANGNVVIDGTLTTAGPTCAGGCDRVFDADYALPSIAEHAEQMFSGGYLPSIGATVPHAPVNLSERQGLIINSLEHAHIYIAQQNERLDQQADLIAELTARLDGMQAHQQP